MRIQGVRIRPEDIIPKTVPIILFPHSRFFLPIILSNFRLFPIFYLLFFASFPNLMHKKKDYTN